MKLQGVDSQFDVGGIFPLNQAWQVAHHDPLSFDDVRPRANVAGSDVPEDTYGADVVLLSEVLQDEVGVVGTDPVTIDKHSYATIGAAVERPSIFIKA